MLLCHPTSQPSPLIRGVHGGQNAPGPAQSLKAGGEHDKMNWVIFGTTRAGRCPMRRKCSPLMVVSVCSIPPRSLLFAPLPRTLIRSCLMILRGRGFTLARSFPYIPHVHCARHTDPQVPTRVGDVGTGVRRPRSWVRRKSIYKTFLSWLGTISAVIHAMV